ncbi:MAG: MFS transporter [Pseudomonadota bacterium]
MVAPAKTIGGPDASSDDVIPKPVQAEKSLWRSSPAIGAGLLLTLSSSFGQTFFLSLFGGVWRQTFDLSHGVFGGLYAGATLASAVALLALGKSVDHARPRYLSLALLLLTALSAYWVSTAASVWALGFGLFAMRLLGQGLLSHVAMTSIAKWFSTTRGRVLSIAMLGYPIGEALLPYTAASVMAALNWQAVWIAVASVTSFVLAPIVFNLSKRAEAGVGDKATVVPGLSSSDEHEWSRREALRDWRFYAACPGLLASPFIITSVFFHQAHLAEIKGWTLGGFAALYPLYAMFSITAGLLCGFAVDKVGTRNVLPYFLVPLAAGISLAGLSNSLVVGAAMMAMLGATAGMATVLYTSIWSEMYGTHHLGAIRSVAHSALVFSSALGPVLTGAGLDIGISIDTQMKAMAGYALLCCVLFSLLRTHLVRRAPNSIP